MKILVDEYKEWQEYLNNITCLACPVNCKFLLCDGYAFACELGRRRQTAQIMRDDYDYNES